MNKKSNRSNILNFAAFICFTLALVLLVLLRLFQIESVVVWYNKYTDTLASYEQWIQSNGTSLFSVAMILANFVIKAIIPWFPISCICVAAGVLFPWYYAILINVAGLVLLFTIKFFWGRRFGGGNAEKILSKYDNAHEFIDSSKLGSKMVLFIARLFPCLPINSISQLYGTTSISYWKYLLVSLIGFTYKLFSYTLIGHNVYNPMSASFILPFVFLFLFSGIVILALNGVISITVGTKKKHEK
ncbi:MAG: VTT domain-containing protein [Faecalibacterium sp.]|nr:VTT domain-containing protein [Ruminococcus sp.]MCM1486592.1 VTT domain-containing protein [Faecalibacterium sp.]